MDRGAQPSTATAIPINIRGSLVGEGAWEVSHNRSLKQDTHTVAPPRPSFAPSPLVHDLFRGRGTIL